MTQLQTEPKELSDLRRPPDPDELMARMFDATVLRDLRRLNGQVGLNRPAPPPFNRTFRLHHSILRSERKRVATTDVVGAMFKEEWWPAQAVRWATLKIDSIRRVSSADFRRAPGFDAHDWATVNWDNLNKKQRSHLFAGDYDEAVSEGQMAWLLQRTDASDEAREILELAGVGQSLFSGLMVGLADPFNIALGLGLAKLGATSALKTTGILGKLAKTYQSSRLARTGIEVAGGFIATTAGESLLLGTNQNYDLDQAASVLVFSTLLDTSIQSMFSGIGRAVSGKPLPLKQAQLEVAQAVRARDAQEVGEALRVRYDDALDVWERSEAGEQAGAVGIVSEIRDEAIARDVTAEIEVREAGEAGTAVVQQNAEQWRRDNVPPEPMVETTDGHLIYKTLEEAEKAREAIYNRQRRTHQTAVSELGESLPARMRHVDITPILGNEAFMVRLSGVDYDLQIKRSRAAKVNAVSEIEATSEIQKTMVDDYAPNKKVADEQKAIIDTETTNLVEAMDGEQELREQRIKDRGDREIAAGADEAKARAKATKERTAQAPEPPRAKEPWEMSSLEYSKQVDPEGHALLRKGADSEAAMRTRAFEIEAGEHKELVEAALAEGKPVPAKVLADYPDLAVKAAEAPDVSATARARGREILGKPWGDRVKPNDSGTGPVSLTDPPLVPLDIGRETEVVVRGADGQLRRLKAVYVLTEVEDPIPTHNPFTFERLPNGDLNMRPYGDTVEGRDSRATARRIGEMQPHTVTLILSDTLSPVDGPKVMTQNGVVEGGTARTIGENRAYAAGGEVADRLRQGVIREAPKFGLSADKARKANNPTVGRMLLEDPGQPGELSRLFNQSLTTATKPATEAVSRGAKITPQTAAKIRTAIGHKTLAEAMGSKRQTGDIVRALHEAGALDNNDIASLFRENGLPTDEGKAVIRQTLLGAVIPDAGILSRTAQSTQNTLIRAMPALIRLRAIGGKIEFQQALFDAIEGLVVVVRDRDLVDLNDILDPNFGTLLGATDSAWKQNPRAIALVRTILDVTPTTMARKLEELANRIDDANSGQAVLFGGTKVETAEDIFDDIFVRNRKPPGQQLDAAMGAAGAREFIGVTDNEASKIVTAADLDERGNPKARDVTSNVARMVGKTVGDVSPGGRLTPVSETRESPNHFTRLVANTITDLFVPLKGHALNHPRLYRGERMESVLKATGFWRAHSIDLWNKLTAEVTAGLGQNATARSIGERFGVLGLMNDARRIVDNVFLEYDRGLVRAKRRLAALEAGTLPGIAPKELDDLRAFIAVMESRFEASFKDLDPNVRQVVRDAFDKYMLARDDLAAKSVGRTPAGKAIDAMHKRSKDFAVVRYGDEIQNAVELDEAIRSVEAVRTDPDAEIRDSFYWRERGLDADNADHLRMIREKLNAQQPHVRLVSSTPGILDLLGNHKVRFSNLDTIELLSGLRKEAVSDYFLNIVNDQFGLIGSERLDSWERVATHSRANARKGGVNIDDPVQLARSERGIGKALQMVRVMLDTKTSPASSLVAEALYGSLRNMATAAYLVKTPISLVNELSQTFILRIAREGSFGRGVAALISDVQLTIKSATGRDRHRWREWLSAFHSMDEARPGRGFEMMGELETGGQRASSSAFFEPATGSFASQVVSIVVNSTREMAELATSGKLLGKPVPVLRQVSMDGITRGLRRLAIIGHYRWFYNRLDDWVKISDAMRTNQYGTPAEAIRGLDLQHTIEPGDWTTISSFIDNEQLRRLAERRIAGDGIEMIEGTPVFNANTTDEGALRNFLDHVAQYEATTTPTVGTIPLSVQQNPMLQVFWQFMNFSTAFGNQNVMLTRLRSGVLQGSMMGAIMGAAMFDLFTRDALFHDWDTAVDRWKDDTRTVGRTARYLSEVIARTGYLNIADLAVKGLMDFSFGDAFERRLAPEHAVIPPALGYGEDLIRALGTIPRALGPGELTRSERELLRRVTVVSNMLPLRILLPSEQPPPRFTEQEQGGD